MANDPGRLISHNFVAEFTSAGIATGLAKFDGIRYRRTGTLSGVSDQLKPITEWASGTSAGIHGIAYSCVASHGAQDPFFASVLSSGTGGGIVENGRKVAFSYTKL